MRTTSNFIALLLFLLTAISATAQFGTNNRILFVANMTGQQEVPAVNTAARGVVTFLFSEDRSTISVHGVFTGLSGPITACHIHTGVEGVSGPVLTNFTPNLSGNRVRAEIAVPAGLLAKGLLQQLYFNVHTAANPGGEIRGQLELMTDEFYVAVLNGLNETPPVLVTATGVGLFAHSPGSSFARYSAVVNGLTGPVTASHIHNGASGVAGPVVAPLSVSGNTLNGNLDLSALSSDFLQKLHDGDLYINVHTAANPGGEIRSQLTPIGPLAFETFLNGDQETPPVTTSAVGIAVAGLNATLDSLTYFVQATGLTPTAAHFHKAAPGTAGGVVVALVQSPVANLYTAKIAVNSTFVSDLLNGNIYVNIHTAANPGGEIRGQMEPLLRRVYAFDLCGDQEVPATGSSAQGAAVISTDRLNTHLSYLYVVDGLSGPATAAHIHDGAFGVGGPVYLPVNTPAPVGSGQFQISGTDAVKLESGNTYLNVHTAANPGGEIRGQVVRGLNCSANTPVVEPATATQAIFPNPTSGDATLSLLVHQPFDGQLILGDPAGRTVFTENHTFVAGAQVLSLDMSTLPAGLYFGQIVSAQYGTIYAFKIVKE